MCGARLTIGVAHRVETLADRAISEAAPPPTADVAISLVPLPEILSEVIEAGVASQGVTRAYDRVVAALGPELSLLEDVPIEDIARQDGLLGEAVTRLRKGAVIRQAGYDGEYGVIRLFDDAELSRLTKGGLLFPAPAPRLSPAPPAAPKTAAPRLPAELLPVSPALAGDGALAELDEDQRLTAEAVDGPLIVLAGPGAGKTRMLAGRIAHLVLQRGAGAASCLAVTFTRRATEELLGRLAVVIPRRRGQCAVHSLHSLGLEILRADGGALGLKSDFSVADDAQRRSILARELQAQPSRAARLSRAISLVKRTGATANSETAAALAVYWRLSREQNWIDFALCVVAAFIAAFNPKNH